MKFFSHLFTQGKEAIEHLSFLAKCDTNKVKNSAALAVSSFGKFGNDIAPRQCNNAEQYC